MLSPEQRDSRNRGRSGTSQSQRMTTRLDHRRICCKIYLSQLAVARVHRRRGFPTSRTTRTRLRGMERAWPLVGREDCRTVGWIRPATAVSWAPMLVVSRVQAEEAITHPCPSSGTQIRKPFDIYFYLFCSQDALSVGRLRRQKHAQSPRACSADSSAISRSRERSIRRIGTVSFYAFKWMRSNALPIRFLCDQKSRPRTTGCDEHSDESETSSVCSDRSFDSVNRRLEVVLRLLAAEETLSTNHIHL